MLDWYTTLLNKYKCLTDILWEMREYVYITASVNTESLSTAYHGVKLLNWMLINVLTFAPPSICLPVYRLSYLSTTVTKHFHTYTPRLPPKPKGLYLKLNEAISSLTALVIFYCFMEVWTQGFDTHQGCPNWESWEVKPALEFPGNGRKVSNVSILFYSKNHKQETEPR